MNTHTPKTHTLKTKLAAGLLAGLTVAGALGAGTGAALAEVEHGPPPIEQGSPNYVTTSHLLVKNLKGYTVKVVPLAESRFADPMTDTKFTISSDEEDLHLDATISPFEPASRAHWAVALHDANDKSVGLYWVTYDQNSAGDPFWTNIATSHTTPDVKATNVGQSTNQIVRT